jgi:DNA-binding SARP family transcriptional activator
VLHLTTLGQLAVRREDVDSEPLPLQPKRLGLLAYLALGSTEAGFHRRDVLLALFWPEHSHAAGRHALRHALYDLRHTLGNGILLGRMNEEVGLAQGLQCDARALEEANQA